MERSHFWSSSRLILGQLLLNIYLCDLFMFTDNIDIGSYADDTTPYVSGVTLDSTMKSLEKVADLLFTWFNYQELLDKDDSVSVHQKNLQKLAIEMFNTYTMMDLKS